MGKEVCDTRCESECDSNLPNVSQSVKKRKQKKIVVFSLVLMFVSAALYFVASSYLPIYNSQKAFYEAQQLEQAYDYDLAVERYKDVIQADEDNYSVACEKIAQLEGDIRVNKFAAKAVIALLNEGFAYRVEDINGLAVNTVPNRVTCKIDGVGFVVSDSQSLLASVFNSSSLDKDLGTYANEYIESATGLYITEYRPSAYVGWYMGFGNEIKKATSNRLFEGERSLTSSQGINELLVQHYVDKYQESRDISIVG